MTTDTAHMILALAAAYGRDMPWIPVGPTATNVPTNYYFRRSAAKRAKLRRRLGR